jgi:hypothetical protein
MGKDLISEDWTIDYLRRRRNELDRLLQVTNIPLPVRRKLIAKLREIISDIEAHRRDMELDTLR